MTERERERERMNETVRVCELEGETIFHSDIETSSKRHSSRPVTQFSASKTIFQADVCTIDKPTRTKEPRPM